MWCLLPAHLLGGHTQLLQPASELRQQRVFVFELRSSRAANPARRGRRVHAGGLIAQLMAASRVLAVRAWVTHGVCRSGPHRFKRLPNRALHDNRERVRDLGAAARVGPHAARELWPHKARLSIMPPTSSCKAITLCVSG